MDDVECFDKLLNLLCLPLIPLSEVLDVGVEVGGPGVQITPQFLYDVEVMLSQNTCLIFDGQELELSEVHVGTPWTTTGKFSRSNNGVVSQDGLGKILRVKIFLVLCRQSPSRGINGAPVEHVPSKIRGKGDPCEIGNAQKVNLSDPHLIELEEEQRYSSRIEIPRGQTQPVELQMGELLFDVIKLFEGVTLDRDEKLNLGAISPSKSCGLGHVDEIDAELPLEFQVLLDWIGYLGDRHVQCCDNAGAQLSRCGNDVLGGQVDPVLQIHQGHRRIEIDQPPV